MKQSVRVIRRIYLILIALLVTALLAGCVGKPSVTVIQTNQDMAAEAETQPNETAEPPTVTDTLVHTYEAVDTQIIRDDGQVIYDASPFYFMADDYCGITDLVDDGEALYFVEYGIKEEYDPDLDDPSTDYAIVSINYDGQNRQELVGKSDIGGYTDLTLFGDRLFFIDDGSDCEYIGDVSKDGKAFNVIDWEAYAARFNAEPYFLSASFSQDQDYLYVQLSLYEEDIEGVTRDVRIDKNMKLVDMPLKEDQYLVSGSKIIMLSKVTGEKSVFYDAADYYSEVVIVNTLMETDEMLVFEEDTMEDSIYTSHCFVVTLDKQNQNRNVLCSSPDGHWYTDVILFNNCIFFAEKNIDYSWIGHMALTGGDVSYIELTPEQQAYSVVWMETEGDILKIDMVNHNGDIIEHHTLLIDKDLNVSWGEIHTVDLNDYR